MPVPVNKVVGIGPKTTEYLKTKRITTAEALIKFGVEKLSMAPGFSEKRAVTAIESAKKAVSGNGVEKTTTTAGVKKKKDKKQKKDKKNKKEKPKKGKKDKKVKKDKKNRKGKGKNKKNKK